MSDILSDVAESFEDFQLADETTETEGTNEEITEGVSEDNSEEKEETKEEPVKKDEENSESETEDKKPSRLQRRFKHFKTEISKRDAELAEIKRQNAELRRQYGLVDDDGLPLAPNPKQFKNEREYRDAYLKWDNEVTQLKGDKETKTQIEFENKAKAFKESIKKEKLKFKDWDEVVNEEFLETPTEPHVQKALMKLDNGADVLYTLAKSPDLLIALNSMTETETALNLGKISEQVKAFVTKNKNKGKVSKAKKVIKKANGDSTVSKDFSKMSMEEYAKARDKELYG